MNTDNTNTDNMNTALTFSPVFAALAFAAERHRDQRRKGQRQSPYVNHLIAVLDLLWDIGGVRDPITLSAAVLHDTLEDTPTRLDELEQLFGAEIAQIVVELSDDKSLPKQRRKDLQIENAGSKSKSAKLVKLADKISNVGDILTDPPQDWPLTRQREYAIWALAVVDQVRGSNLALEARFDALYAQAERQIF
jgi:GTP diphosphokinase / guanosine-3',5'-bis(diphosphate) 3'-diphosphatase